MKDWDTSTPFQAFGRVRDGAMVGPAALFAADVRAELQRRPADVVVGNFFVFGAQIAAEAEGVPFAFLVSNLLSFPGSGTPPLGPGLKPARGPLGRARDAAINRVMARLFDKGLDQLNEVRRANGLEPRDVGARELRARRPAAADDEPRRSSTRASRRRRTCAWWARASTTPRGRASGRRPRATPRSCSWG